MRSRIALLFSLCVQPPRFLPFSRPSFRRRTKMSWRWPPIQKRRELTQFTSTVKVATADQQQLVLTRAQAAKGN